MLPGMVEMIVRIAAAGLMSDPAVVFRMHVRGLRMALLIAIRPPLTLGGCLWRRCAHRSRSARGNVPAANAMLHIHGMPAATVRRASMLLCKCGERKQKNRRG